MRPWWMVPYNNSDAIFVSASCSLVLFWAVVRARVSLVIQYISTEAHNSLLRWCEKMRLSKTFSTSGFDFFSSYTSTDVEALSEQQHQ